MSLDGARSTAESGERAAAKREEEAVEVASQWAQEKLENFMLEVENTNNHRLLNISYIISRRTSIDVFSSKTTDIGTFAKELIQKLAQGKIADALSGLAGSLLNKLIGSSSGSAQSERIYEVTFDELGGLNRLDAYFFCYRFASSGIVDVTKAVIGSCIVRSAASMVDDNAYRVVLTSGATLADTSRTAISQYMIEVAKTQTKTLDEKGNSVTTEPGLQEARARLAQVIGEGVATSEEYEERKRTKLTNKSPFTAATSTSDAADQAKQLSNKITTTVSMESLEEEKKKLEEEKKKGKALEEGKENEIEEEQMDEKPVEAKQIE